MGKRFIKKFTWFFLPVFIAALYGNLLSPNAVLATPTTIERMSQVDIGSFGDGFSFEPVPSADGQFIAFSSDATNFVPGDTNAKYDIFVYDTNADTLERVSLSSAGVEGNDNSFTPNISDDGRYIVFESGASNLVAGDTNSVSDIFVYDRTNDTIERVSVASDGTQGNGSSIDASISGDGRYVAFQSNATNLVAGDTNARTDIFVYDRNTDTVERVSVDTAGTQGNNNSNDPWISNDGAFVTYESNATNLVASDTNGRTDIFLRNLNTDTTTRLSVDNGGTQGNNNSVNARISSDGQFVSFQSSATNLIAGDTNATTDVFVRDTVNNTTERVSIASDGTQANSSSFDSHISGDGRYVVFASDASNLVAGDTNGQYEIFRYDRTTDTIVRISIANDGQQAIQVSDMPRISDDGTIIVFYSSAQNLVDGDLNGDSDVYYYDTTAGSNPLNVIVNSSTTSYYQGANNASFVIRNAVSNNGAFATFNSSSDSLVLDDLNNVSDVFVYINSNNTIERISLDSNEVEGNGASTNSAISSDGRYVAFNSSATNLVAGDTNGVSDIFVRDRTAGTTERVSIATDGTEANGASNEPSISSDGRYVVFYSTATNLVAGDTNAVRDVFIYDRNTDTIERVSVATDGTQGNGISSNSSVSSDGRYVTFNSSATNLVAGDTNAVGDIFVRDRTGSTTERVSVASDGTQGNAVSSSPTISADGQYVAFVSSASNLVASDTNGFADIFVYDRNADTVERVSVAADGTQGNGISSMAGQAMSADGRYVAFSTNSSNILPGDSNGAQDIFIYDRTLDTLTRMNETTGGTAANNAGTNPSISPDGQYVIFDTAATNLVSSDDEGLFDAFIAGLATANQDPDAPTSLGPSGYVDGSSGSDDTPTLTFTLSDPDVSDTVQYRIQIDDSSDFSSPVVDYTSALAAQGSTSFTVGQAEGSGTYTVGSAGQTLSDSSYYWRVKTIDNSLAESSYSTANSGAIAFEVDTAPAPGGGGGGGGSSSGSGDAHSSRPPTTSNPTSTAPVINLPPIFNLPNLPTLPTPSPRPGLPTSTPTSSASSSEITLPDLVLAGSETSSGTRPCTEAEQAQLRDLLAVYYDRRKDEITERFRLEIDAALAQYNLTKNSKDKTVRESAKDAYDSAKNSALEERRENLDALDTWRANELEKIENACVVPYPIFEVAPVNPEPVYVYDPGAGNDGSEISAGGVIDAVVREVIDVLNTAEAAYISVTPPGVVLANENVVDAVARNAPVLVKDVLPPVLLVGVITSGLISTTEAAAIPSPIAAVNFGRNFRLFSVFFGRRKKRYSWGTVYDSVTKQPLDPALVTLLDTDGREVASQVTDLDGRYGFLVEPGEYRIRVEKTHYHFPSNAMLGKRDVIYENLYFGEELFVEQDKPLVIRDIPMDPLNLDWNEAAKRTQGLTSFYSRHDILFTKLNRVLIVVGGAFSVVALVSSPGIYNALVLVGYLLLVGFYFLSKPQTYGKVAKENGSPLAFALIRAYQSSTNVEIRHTVTDVLGRYFCILPNGEYYVRIEERIGPESFHEAYVSRKFGVKKGIIDQVFII